MSEVLQPRSVLRLVRELNEKTQAGSVAWRQLGDSQFRFTAELPRFQVAIASRDEDDAPPFILAVWRRSEPTILIQEIESQIEPDEIGAATNAELAQLYARAKRSVLRLDEIEKELFEDLDKVGEEPF